MPRAAVVVPAVLVGVIAVVGILKGVQRFKAKHMTKKGNFQKWKKNPKLALEYIQKQDLICVGCGILPTSKQVESAEKFSSYQGQPYTLIEDSINVLQADVAKAKMNPQTSLVTTENLYNVTNCQLQVDKSGLSSELRCGNCDTQLQLGIGRRCEIIHLESTKSSCFEAGNDSFKISLGFPYLSQWAKDKDEILNRCGVNKNKKQFLDTNIHSNNMDNTDLEF